MKILIDTNITLDFLLQRDPFSQAISQDRIKTNIAQSKEIQTLVFGNAISKFVKHG